MKPLTVYSSWTVLDALLVTHRDRGERQRETGRERQRECLLERDREGREKERSK